MNMQVALDPLGWNKYGISLAVGRLGKIALQALAFGDIELRTSLAVEDSRGLPRAGEQVRRNDLKIVVQAIGTGQMDVLDHVQITVIGKTYPFADGQKRLGIYADGIHHQCIALPMADGVAKEARIGVGGV